MNATNGTVEIDTIISQIMNILDEDFENEDRILSKIKEMQTSENEEIYSHIFKILVNLDIPKEEAKDCWEKIINYRNNFSRLLGKKFSFRAAMLDYFISENKKLSNPKIIEIKIYENTLKSALLDILTGAFNRRYYDQIIQTEINRARRKKTVISLCVLDIDDFKHFNDTYGHKEGDRVLSTFANVIKKTIRREDILCRYGGEEFVVIMPDAMPQNAGMVMERISEELKSLEFSEGSRMTFSCGIAYYPNDSEDKDELFIKADKAMYTAKGNGKDRVCIYGTERRTKLRFEVNWNISFTLLDSSPVIQNHPGEFAISKTYDVSLDGLCFLTSTKLNVGDMLRVVFHEENQMNFQEKKARVVWVTTVPDGGYKIGLKFL